MLLSASDCLLPLNPKYWEVLGFRIKVSQTLLASKTENCNHALLWELKKIIINQENNTSRQLDASLASRMQLPEVTFSQKHLHLTNCIHEQKALTLVHGEKQILFSLKGNLENF